MEFRSCPACNSSVLEDNVDECPFCGASMSGKPKPAASAAPRPAKPAASAPAKSVSGGAGASKPAAPAAGQPAARPGAAPRSAAGAKPAAGRKEAKETASEEGDDPFEVDTSALRRAVKLAPSPTKVRTLEIKCPMCETVGYLAPADQGKDVQCCNPQCMVPVFKTERPKVEVAPPPKPKSKLPLMIGGVAALGGAVGAAVFLMAPKTPDSLPPAEIVIPSSAPVEDKLVPEQNRVVVREEAPPATIEEIRKKSLELILDRARQRERNRNAEYGYQLAAETFAQAGDLNKAREQVRRLQSGAAYLQIQPLVEIGWQELAKGQQAEARQTAQTATGKAKNLPRTVRRSHDAVVSLVALLTALGQQKEALALIDQEQDHGPRGQVSVLWRTALDARTFDLDVEAGRVWHFSLPEPMRLGAVESLVAASQNDAALALAATGRDEASKSACRAAWAGRLAQLRPADVQSQVEAAIQSGKFNPTTQCQVWAAVGDMARSLKNQPLAESALAASLASFQQIQAPMSVKAPSKKELHDSDGKAHVGLPNPAPAHAAALAAAELGLLQYHLGKTEDGWKTIQSALDFCRGMVPSPAFTQSLLDECRDHEGAVRSELARALNLGSDDQRIRAAFNRYRSQCTKLHQAAQARLQIQVDILRAVARQGGLEPVWTLLQQRSNHGDLQQREPYRGTSLPGYVLALAQAAGKQELVSSIKGTFTEKPLEPDPLDVMNAQASRLVQDGQYDAASDLVERGYRSDLTKKRPDELDQLALQLSGRIQAKATPEAVISYLQNLFDLLVQEDGFLLLAGGSVAQGTAPQLWKITAGSRELDALEFVSLYRGFIAGAAGATSSTPAAAAPSTPGK